MKKRPRCTTKQRVVDLDPSARDGPERPSRNTKRRDPFCSRYTKRRVPEHQWAHVVAGAEYPPWVRHFVDTLRAPLLQLKKKFGDKIRLLMWSDCAGKCTEQDAGRKLADELKLALGIDVEFVFFGACDATRHCKDFVLNNYDPSHFSDDIFARSFLDGTFQCTKCVGTCSLPTSGFDIYCCCFPCGPWSKLGNRILMLVCVGKPSERSST